MTLHERFKLSELLFVILPFGFVQDGPCGATDDLEFLHKAEAQYDGHTFIPLSPQRVMIHGSVTPFHFAPSYFPVTRQLQLKPFSIDGDQYDLGGQPVE